MLDIQTHQGAFASSTKDRFTLGGSYMFSEVRVALGPPTKNKARFGRLLAIQIVRTTGIFVRV